MFYNRISLIVGLIVVGVFSFLWLALALALGLNGISLLAGVIAVFLAIGMGGKYNLPVEHLGLLLILGKRTRIFFQEGMLWIPPLLTSMRAESAKEQFSDIPVIKVLTKDKVEIEVDTQISWRIVDPFNYSNLEDPQKTINERLISKAHEAIAGYIKTNPYNKCIHCEGEIQNEIRDRVEDEVENWGIEIVNVDVKPIMPDKGIRDELAEQKRKEMRTKQFVKDLRRIKNEVGELTDDTLTNVTQTVEGVIKKEVREDKNTFKVDIEPSILRLIAALFKKEGEIK